MKEGDKPFRYVDGGYDINEQIADEILKRVNGSRPKPWTVVSDVSTILGTDNDTVRENLKELMLRGDVTPDADGNLRIYDPQRPVPTGDN